MRGQRPKGDVLASAGLAAVVPSVQAVTVVPVKSLTLDGLAERLSLLCMKQHHHIRTARELIGIILSAEGCYRVHALSLNVARYLTHFRSVASVVMDEAGRVAK